AAGTTRRGAGTAPAAAGAASAAATAAAPARGRPTRARGATHTKVVIERHAIERHHNDLRAVIGAGQDLVVLVDVGYCPGDVSRVAVLQHHARPLHLVPLRAGGAPLVAEDLLVVPGRPGVAVVLPIDAVGRIHVPADPIARARVDDVVRPPAPPDVRILLVGVVRIGYAWYRGSLRVDAVGAGLS